MRSSGCGVGVRGAEVGMLLPLALVLAFGCGAREPEVERPKIDLLAVLPIERAEQGSEEEPADLPEDAGLAVTAQIYRYLAVQSQFRFVADLAVQDAAQRVAVRNAPDLTSRALALGKEVSADAVIFGTVSRFRDRVGTEYDATSPASVTFELGLLDVASGQVVWKDQFTQTQGPLSSSWLNFWMFWRERPHWFSSRELAGLGVDELLEKMTDTVRP